MTNVGFEGRAMERWAIGQEVLYSNHSFKKAKRFVLAVLLLRENMEVEKISRIVGVSKRQIYNYRKTYETQGVAAIAADTRYRPESELEPYKDIIKGDITTRPVATASEASERILELFGNFSF
jgi:transposase